MTPLGDDWRRLLRIWRRTPAHDVDAELAFHFDERIAELRANGGDPDAAQAQATREFGDRARVRADLVTIDGHIERHARLIECVASWRDDLRYVLRSLRRSPGFFAGIVLTFALGIGANAAVFSVLNQLFLAAPPGVVDATHIRRVFRKDVSPATTGPSSPITPVLPYPQYRDVAAAAPANRPIAGYDNDVIQLGTDGGVREVGVQHVLGAFFRVLGVSPGVGRFFSPAELRVPAPARVAVISRGLWRSEFASRVDVVGQSVTLGGDPYVIIGVTRGDFRGADANATDIWVPMNTEWTDQPQFWTTENSYTIQVIAHVDSPTAASQLARAATVAFNAHRLHRPPGSATQAVIGPLVEPALPGMGDAGVSIAIRLAAVAVIILLVACANIGNLLLARGIARRQEIAVRLALGVGRRRLLFLLLGEPVVAALAGSAVALAVTITGGRALRGALMPDVRWVDAPLDLRVVAFTIAAACLAAIVAGLVPALRASRQELILDLGAGSRQGGYQRSRLRTALVALQTALAVLLVGGAGLVVRSLLRVEAIPIGYADPTRIIFAGVRVQSLYRSRKTEIEQRLPALATAIGRMPGVLATGTAQNPPMWGISFIDLALPGRDSAFFVGKPTAVVAFVSPGFFAAVGVRLLQGRLFDASARYGAVTPVLVSEAMASAYWPGRNPIGECMVLGAKTDGCSTVIGVVSNAHTDGIIERQTMLQFYVPSADTGFGTPSTIAVRTGVGMGHRVAASVERLLRKEFGGWAEPHVQLMSDQLAPQLHQWRVGAALFTAAGILALLVAGLGIYSAVSYTFGQRTREFGVRMALGARGSTLVGMVLRDGLRVVVIGILIGLALSWAAGRLVASMLYKTSPHDPVVLLGVTVALVLVAASACLVPALRASRVDPVIALRAE